jgi:hypothetical protein
MSNNSHKQNKKNPNFLSNECRPIVMIGMQILPEKFQTCATTWSKWGLQIKYKVSK